MIYFIECAGRIKIGYAKDVKDRIRGLSTSAAHDLTLLCSIEGSRYFETAIHRELKPYRLRGEWFEDCEPVRSLMLDLRLRGPQAISFVEPPSRKASPATPSRPFGESPLRPVMARIDACMDRYVGTQVSAALRRETQIGLEKGTLANKRIGGFYTSERAGVAFMMIKDTMSAVEDLTSVIFESLFDPDGDPIDQEVIVLPAVELVERLERGLSALFAPEQLETIDMRGYAPS